jgi:hypothetical protein
VDETEIASLSDKACVDGLSRVANAWLDHRPQQAASALLVVAVERGKSFSELPAWVLDPTKSDREAAALARSALEILSAGNDDEVVLWTRTAVRESSEDTAQIFDPVSLGIIGAILIGAILASRVKKAGPFEFYEGIPPELVDVLKAASEVGGGSSGPPLG